jgi:hypothetical protein
MDSNHKPYEYLASFNLLDGILDTPSTQFEEVDSLPDRDRLTFDNGFYAYCSALFVDIRESSELAKKYKRPALAKLYRAFISETVAVLNSLDVCREINSWATACGASTTPRPSLGSTACSPWRIRPPR